MRKMRGRSRGQALVEFALVVPLFLLMLFAIVDFSRYVYSNNSLNEVAREAARQGTVALRPALCNGLTRTICVQTLVKSRVTAVAIKLSDVTVSCQRLNSSGALIACPATWQANDLVTVTIQTNLGLITPLIGQFVGQAPMTGVAKVTASG